MATPKVSILIPAREEGVWLAHTLESISRHTAYPNYEVIVVDDASKDGGADGLEARFPEMDLTVLRVPPQDAHGPAISRNKALEMATGEYILTIDAHEVVPDNWVTDLMALSAEHPRAFIQAMSTGFRSVKDTEVRIIGTNLDDSQVRARVKPILDEVKCPCVLEVSKSSRTVGGNKKLTQKFQVPVVYGPSVKDDEPVQFVLHVKSPDLDPELPDPALHYGCVLDFDPEDRNFITPKWTPWAHKRRRPTVPYMRVPGFMGATYLFPRKLFEDSLGGWPWVEGWVNEEPYLSIAAGIQDIPILVHCGVATAHNYDRVDVSPHNAGSKDINRKLTTAMCFDDMKDEIEKTIFSQTVGPLFAAQYDPTFSERRAKIQTGRRMSDMEFLGRNGLLQYFHPAMRKKAMERFGAGATNLSTAEMPGIKNALDQIAKNPKTRWAFCCINLQSSENAEVVLRLIAVNPWDEQTNKRAEGMAGASMKNRNEMVGSVSEALIGLQTVHYLKDEMGVIWGGQPPPKDEPTPEVKSE